MKGLAPLFVDANVSFAEPLGPEEQRVYESLREIVMRYDLAIVTSRAHKVMPPMGGMFISLEMRPEDVERRMEFAMLKSRELPVDPDAPHGYVMTEGGPVRRAAPMFIPTMKIHDFGERGTMEPSDQAGFLIGSERL